MTRQLFLEKELSRIPDIEKIKLSMFGLRPCVCYLKGNETTGFTLYYPRYHKFGELVFRNKDGERRGVINRIAQMKQLYPKDLLMDFQSF